MGTRPTITPPASAVRMRDYRTLSLPAIDDAPDRWRPLDDRKSDRFDLDELDEQEDLYSETFDNELSNYGSWVEHSAQAPRQTRTLMAAARHAPHDVAPRQPRHWREDDDDRLVKSGRSHTARAMASTATASVVIPAAPSRGGRRTEGVATLRERVATHAKTRRFWIVTNLAILAVVALGFAAPKLESTDAAAGCNWHTVVPNDTLGNLGYANHTTAMALAQANHIANPNLIYVGQRLCIPFTTWGQAQTAAAVLPTAHLAAPVPAAPAKSTTSTNNGVEVSAGGISIPVNALPAGEPCTADRSIVWTVPVSRWAIPPGCFGGVYSPNPYNFMVNGQVIPGFGWCNWWPEALVRDPYAIDRPRHSTPRVGVPVYWAPQPGESVGHYGFVESIGTGQNAGWILISEMNMYWRGAGWQKVDYRYIRVDYPGANYLYY
jgi:LysM domain